jgi:integrase
MILLLLRMGMRIGELLNTKARDVDLKERRIEMFRAIADGVRRCDKKVRIALCKETPQVWKAVGLEGKGLFCNCTG